MTYSATAAGNYYVRKGVLSRRPVDPMKLQKLIYFAHGWHLAIHGRPLINERVEAWPYGPVVPSIYHRVKAHGAGPIDFPIFQSVDGINEPPQVADPDTLALLDKVWEVYGGCSSVELSRMSHDPDGPWYRTWNDHAGRGAIRGVDIPDSEIRRYFVLAAKKRRGDPHQP
ncbi:MAG: SocA family protein [bacterium]|nr:SocA family protein [bacterium]